jgi:hypothetical protein
MLRVLVPELKPELAMESQEDSIDIEKLKRIALGLAVSQHHAIILFMQC